VPDAISRGGTGGIGMKFFRHLAAALLAATLATPAWAGPQYVDGSGFAASGYDVVAFFELQQSAVGTAQPPAVPGDKSLTATYNGATFAFATEANRAKFMADPATYAPQFDGHCAYGVAKGAKVPGNPNLWRIVDGKLYLNLNQDVVASWEEDIPGNLQTAAGTWPELDPEAASADPVPELDPAVAPVAK
jgi:YHS domain-containing protein